MFYKIAIALVIQEERPNQLDNVLERNSNSSNEYLVN